MRKQLLVILLFFAVAHAVQAAEPDRIISNSAYWQDVYSVMLYGNLAGKSAAFLVSTRHSTLMLGQISSAEHVWVMTSPDAPFVMGYKALLENKGTTAEEFRYDNLNLELARLLDVDDFIIVDDSYGYNAISVAPYAALKRAYVLFANRRNINQVMGYLDGIDVDELVIYGQVDRVVKERLAAFDPVIINEGDRFSDNLKIVDMYQEEHTRLHGEPKKQAVLTNGEFIEREIMSGVEPVIFIGRASVPEQVREYVDKSDIDIGVLIGNELVGTATVIKRELGISVFVKFAQSARNPEGPISHVEDLDRFYLPRYLLYIDVFSMQYNRYTNQLEVTYENKVNLATWLKGTITLSYDGGTQVVGDLDPVFLDKGEFKTFVYDVNPMSGDIRADIFTLFGESRRSLEYQLRKSMSVDVVDIIDNARINITRVMYDPRGNAFLVEVINVGDVPAYVKIEISDLLVNDQIITVGSDSIVKLEPGESKLIPVSVDLSEEDIANNPIVEVVAYYGERERSLVHILRDQFSYSTTGFGYLTGQVIRGAVKNVVVYLPILIIILLILLILRMKKRCRNCNHRNPIRAERCAKCGAEL